MSTPASLIVVENILEFARAEPDRMAFRILNRGHDPIDLSYGDLVARAHGYARLFISRGVEPQQVVVLLLEHGADLVSAFIGALLCRAVPAIFATPSHKIPDQLYQESLRMMLSVCDSRHLLTDERFASDHQWLPRTEGLDNVITTGEWTSSPPSEAPIVHGLPEDLALLQHSSGTTGLKKGIALTNRCIMNQIRNYAEVLQPRPDDKIACWLPLYHDMGLIANFILPLTCGIPVILMSPFDWLRDPVSLLEIMHEERCTLVWLPNFAYNYYATRVPEARLEGLDFSHVRAFFNGAEPISARTHEAFLDRYRPYGVRPESMGTGYGMAENTLTVTHSQPGRPVELEEIDWEIFKDRHEAVPPSEDTRVRRTMVSSGTVFPNTRIRIVDDNRRDLPERHVGEIAVQSNSLFSGYFRRPDLTAEVIEDGWYFSGDLGYVADGQLFVKGRKKDLIIVAGTNIYPDDLEEIASAVPGVHPGRVVAFGVFNEDIGTEKVVILAETDETDPGGRKGIVRAVVQDVRDALDCGVHHVGLLPHMALLKSTSGKISRSANQARSMADLETNDPGGTMTAEGAP